MCSLVNFNVFLPNCTLNINQTVHPVSYRANVLFFCLQGTNLSPNQYGELVHIGKQTSKSSYTHVQYKFHKFYSISNGISIIFKHTSYMTICHLTLGNFSRTKALGSIQKVKVPTKDSHLNKPCRIRDPDIVYQK